MPNFEGFDFQRAQDSKKSAKDAFAELAKKAPEAPLGDKAALGAWFDQYIKPGMNALGHQVISNGGDGFRFKNWQGTYDVDFGRGAGAPGGALAWQATDPYAPQPSAQASTAPRTLGSALGVGGMPVSGTMPSSSALPAWLQPTRDMVGGAMQSPDAAPPISMPWPGGGRVWSEEMTLPDGTVVNPGGTVSPKNRNAWFDKYNQSPMTGGGPPLPPGMQTLR